jgi:hypothetical protein
MRIQHGLCTITPCYVPQTQHTLSCFVPSAGLELPGADLMKRANQSLPPAAVISSATGMTNGTSDPLLLRQDVTSQGRLVDLPKPTVAS